MIRFALSMLRTRASLRSHLLSGSALVGLAAIVLCPNPAYATCDVTSPGAGTTVTCVSAGGAEGSTISGGANNVTVNVGNAAEINVGAGNAVSLGTGTNINLDTNAIIQNGGANTITIGSGNVNLTGSGSQITANTGGTHAITSSGALSVNVGSGTSITASTNAAQKAIFYTGGGGDSVSVTLSGTITANAAGTAIDFGNSDATFTLTDTGAVTGLVTAGSGTTDSFILGGTGSSIFSATDIGVKFTNFDDFTKQGSGSWALIGTGTQNWTVSAGTLQGDVTSLQGNVANSGTVVFDSPTGTYGGVISGTGALTVQGGNALTLSGNNTYSGGTSITGASTTVIGTTSSIQGAVSSAAASNILRFDQAGNGTYGGAYSGSGALQVQGGGNVTLSGNNTYSGGTTLSGAGTSLIGTTSSIQGSISAGAGTDIEFNQSSIGTYGGSISGGGSVAVTGTGTGIVNMTGISTYTGGTTISGGARVNIDAESGLGNASGDLVLSGGTIGYNFAFSTSRATTLGPSNGTIDNVAATTMSGIISGSGNLTKIGGGALTLSGTNTYTGATNINAGTISVAADNNLGNGGALNLDNGTLFQTGSFTTSRTMSLGAGNGTFNTNGNNLTASGNISGAGGFTKTGLGALTLTGNNTYSGNITLLQGDLTGNTSSLRNNIATSASTNLTFDQSAGGTFLGVISGAGSLTKTNGGILSLTGANTYSGGTLISGGTLRVNTASISGNITNDATLEFQQVGNAAYSGVVSGVGSFVKTGGGNLTLSGANTYTGGTLISNGTLTGTTTTLQGDITNNALLALTDSGTVTFASNVSGSGALIYSGSGVLTLSGTNTYVGGTQITGGGTLAYDDDTKLGNASGNIVMNGGTLRTDAAVSGTRAINLTGGGTINTNSFNSSMSGIISGSGGLTKSGAGILTLGGTNTYTGGTSITGGSVAIGDDNDLGAIGGALTLNAGTLQFDTGFTTARATTLAGAGTINTNGNAVTMSNVISGAGSLTKSGLGNLTLSGTNTYSGGTTVSAGTLTGTTTSLQGNITNNANVAIDQSTTGTYAGTMSGTGALTKSGTGTVTLSGTNTYSGGTTVSGGTVIIGAESGLGNASGAVTLNGATLEYSAGFATTRATTLGAGNGTINTNANNVTMSGAVSGAGALTKSGAGTLTLSGTNTYSGGTTVSGGTVAVGTDSSLGNTSGALTLNSGTLQYDTGFTSTRNMSLGAGNGTVNTNGNNATISGVVSGAGALTKTGAGTLTVSGTNTYAGGTTVTGGTLNVSADNNLGAASTGLTLDGATLQYGTGFTSNRTVTLGAGNGIIDTNGQSATISGVLLGSGSLTKIGAGTLTLTSANAHTGGTIVSAGTLQGNAISLVGNITNNATVDFNQTSIGSYGGVISGTGAVTKQGAGTLTLLGANTYSGGTTINAGNITGTATSIQGDVNIVNAPSNLTIDGAGTYTGTLSGAGSFTKTSAGTLVVSGANTHTGGTFITGGAINISAADNLGGVGNVVTIDGASIILGGGGFTEAHNITIGAGDATINTNGNNATFSGVISGIGETLTKTGAGTLTLTGTNTYSGGTTVSAGILRGDTASLQGNITNNATVNFSQVGLGTYSGIMSGTGNVTSTNTGITTLSGVSTYTGGTTVSGGGALAINAESGLGAASGALTLNNGGLIYNSALSTTRATTLAGAGTFNTNGNDVTMSGVISGAGSLTKAGAGNLTVTGTNTYSGGTTVTAGTLTGTTTSLQGNITNDATVVFDQGTAGTYAGSMSGSGTLTKLGAGNVTLSGGNSYSGGTTVTAGTLTGTTSSLQGAITNNATVVFDQNSAGTYAGAMSGTGTMTKLGTGNLTLSGANTYSGGTVITAGTLTGTIATIQGNITNNAALVFDQGGVGSHAGVISGTGSLTKLGVGNVILLGNNTYSGGTTVTAGTLTGSTDNIQGNVVNNATVVLNQGTTGTYAGNMSGSGTLTKLGTGNITLSGTNTYSGGTTVTAGTLTGTTSSLQGNITNNANVVFNQGTTGTYAGVMSGTGTLTKNGTGNTIISGVNTYSGATTVNAGRLSVNGSNINSTTTVASGGTLGGTGTLGTTVVNNGGRFAPGNSIGTINVTGPVTFNVGSTYEVEINDAGQSDLTIATGAITINGGTVDVKGASGTYGTSTNYTILQGASVTGTFTSLIDDLAFLDPSLTYNATNVVLTMARNTVDFGAIAEDRGQFEAAESLEGLGSGNTLYDLIVGYSTTDARNAFNLLSGESTAAAIGTIAATNDTTRTVIMDRMASVHALAETSGTQQSAPQNIEPAAGGLETVSNEQLKEMVTPQSRYSMWGEALGTRGTTDATGGAPEQDRNSVGTIFGMDRLMDDEGYFGIYAGAEMGEVETDSQRAKSDVDSYHVGVYRSKPIGNDGLRVSGAVGGSIHSIETTRNIAIPGFSAKAEGDTTGASVSTFVELSKTYKTPAKFRIEPFVSLNASGTRIDGFRETGGGAANLIVGDTSTSSYGHTLGLRLGKTMTGPNNFKLSIRGSAGWQHNYGDTQSDTTMRFASGSTPFNAYGAERARDSAVVSLSADTLIGGKTTGYAHYNGAMSKDDQDHKLTVGLRIPFSVFEKDKTPKDPITFGNYGTQAVEGPITSTKADETPATTIEQTPSYVYLENAQPVTPKIQLTPKQKLMQVLPYNLDDVADNGSMPFQMMPIGDNGKPVAPMPVALKLPSAKSVTSSVAPTVTAPTLTPTETPTEAAPAVPETPTPSVTTPGRKSANTAALSQVLPYQIEPASGDVAGEESSHFSLSRK
ncbi:MAG: hypothetical protein EBQ96_02535 [Proteobacteria bacterium]|nr:hypothetical protein [Pseudomonadota bacterium]